MAGNKLTPKQQRFVDEYLVDLNATAAAQRAGYSTNRASEIGYQLLQKTTVQEEIQKRRKQLQGKLEITQERVLQELACIAFADAGDFVQVTEGGSVTITPTRQLSKQQRAAIAGIKETANGVEIKLHSKPEALEMLGKYLNLFDRSSAPEESQSNNIIDVIQASTEGELDISGIPEIEPSAKPGHDMVEPSGPKGS